MTTPIAQLARRLESRPPLPVQVGFIQAGLTANSAWIAFILAMPGVTFKTNTAWAWFASIMPEGGWSLVFALQALAGGISMYTRSQTKAVLGMALVTAINGLLAAGIALSSVIATGYGTYLIHAVMSGWVLYYLRFPLRTPGRFW